MSIMSYNGGAVIAMTGKDCVGIAADRRLGAQGHTISINFERIFEMGPKLYIGLPGLATDTQTVSQRLKFRMNLFELQEVYSLVLSLNVLYIYLYRSVYLYGYYYL